MNRRDAIKAGIGVVVGAAVAVPEIPSDIPPLGAPGPWRGFHTERRIGTMTVPLSMGGTGATVEFEYLVMVVGPANA